MLTRDVSLHTTSNSDQTADASQGAKYARGLSAIPDLVKGYLNSNPNIDLLVKWVIEARTVFFLGRGYSAPVAEEALKLMEVAYIPCIAYPSGEMKHGPIALLEEGSPVIVIAPRDSWTDKTVSNLQECKARVPK